ncbi:MAG: hypothetical protein K2K70_08905 [Lachnospiraceae bacterium]|nr:hypothetical protein [Lachnospiraceae bacterium]
MDSISIVLLLGLLVCSWEDVRSYMVSLPFVIIWTGLLCGMQIYQGNMDLVLMITPVAIIGITTIVCHLSKGGIGLGDGFLFAMAVMGLGVAQGLQMFFYCLTGAFCAAVIVLVFFSGKKDSRIPLAPFIFGGSLLAIL